MENDIKNEEELEQEITYPISISIDMEKSFSYAYYHTDARLKIDNYSKNTSYSFIRSITIKNDYDKSFKDLKLKFIFSHDAFSTYDININSIGINEEKDISVPFIIVKKELLDSINEPMPAFLKLVIYDKDNNILSEIENGFNILPVSQLLIDCFDNRLFAKFVTPECQIVKQITVDASNILNRSLIAYQNKDKNKILEEVEAIYKAIHNYGITYQVAPSKRTEIQRVRMPYEVLTDRKGNCLDLSILFAACLEEVGYNPIIQFGETHALAGFFLDDVEDSTDSEITTASFPHGIEKRDYVIRNLFGSKILIFDAVYVVADKNISFQGAIDCGKDYVMTNYGPEFMAVDVKTCHLNAFSPIPSFGNSDSIIEKINPQTLIDRQVEEISNDKYTNVLKPEEKSRFTFWERKLLDLSEANPLVNFKPDSKRTVRLISENPIYEAIFNNDVVEISTSFITKNGKKIDGDSGLTGQSFDYLVDHPDTKPSHFNPIINNKDLLYAVGYERTFDELIKKSNSNMEETGAQTLYICFGILTYKRKNGEVGQAPFGILPIEKLTKSKAGGKYYVSVDSNEFMINQTFFEYYKNEHQGIDFSELYSCNINDGYMNIVNTFKSNSDIRLEEKAVFICNLTFSHYIMWQDIRKRQDILKENKVVESIIQNRNLLNETPSYNGQDIDDIEKYADFAAPLPYDSTQLLAILESGNGKSFILDGPPGTGKSQTIVNMIVNAFYHGKTVLFVAEKKAALDVVYDRLEKIKLGRFALELHSNKANKDNFYNKLNESMELGTTIAPFDFNINCIDLEAKRDKLRSIINSMKENKYLYSLYDSIVLYENLKQEGYEYSIKLDKDYLKSLTKDTYNEINVLIDKLIALSKSINDYENNPLRFISLKELRFSNRNEILNDFNAVNKLFIEFDKAYNDFMARFNIDIKYKNINIDSLINSLNILFNKPNYNQNVLLFNNENDNELINNIFVKTKELIDFTNKNQDIYNYSEFNNIDVKSIRSCIENTTGFFKKLKLKSLNKKLLSPCLKIKYKNNDINQYLSDIESYNDLMKYLNDNNKLISDKIGFDYLSNYNDYENIQVAYNNTIDLLSYINKSDINVLNIINRFKEIKDDNEIKYLFEILNKTYISYKDIEHNILTDKYQIKWDYLLNGDSYNNYKNVLNYICEEKNFNEVLNITTINPIITELDNLGIKDFICDLNNNKFQLEDLKSVIELSVVNGLLEIYFEDDSINYFNSESFDYEVDKYREYIKKYSDSVIEETAARLSSKLDYNSINYRDSSSIGQLKKIFTMKRNKPSIRETLLKYDDIIKDFFPCFLMSPLSAAQYLAVDKDARKFDIVIFDEASQIPTHEAVGPIARGNSLIVAGDPKQMPPTLYFNSDIEISEDDIEFEDSASLLDECLAIDLPRIRLSYHYRSKHESLIEFSNRYFYKDGLYTFPSPDVSKSELSFTYVTEDEKKKTTQISKQMLEALWNKIEEIYTDPKTYNRSLGIVVFNVIQKAVVDDFINKKLRDNQNIKEKLLEAEERTKEPLFIKSLENVQGDERDIIILCISFRLNMNGNPTITGPLAANNGERRLNVAASRSKYKMILVSNIKSSDFLSDEGMSRNRNNGALYLKRLIMLAEGNDFNIDNKNDDNKLSLVNFIQNDLEALGYDVDINIGRGDHKVDLAIKNKDSDSYSLGILLDNKIDTSIRDELYLNESFLTTGLNWNIINIYSVEYFKNPKKVIDYIISNIGKIIKTKMYDIDPLILKAPTEEFKYETKEYVEANGLIPLSYSPEFGFNEANMNRNLDNIINTEGPVSFNIIKKHIKEAAALKKLSTKAEEYIKLALAKLDYVTSVDFDEKGKEIAVYWPKDMSNMMTYFRLSNRDINDIPREEIAAAMKQIIKSQGEMNKEDLYREALLALEYSDKNLTLKNRNKLDQAYDFGFKKGFLDIK